LVGNPEVIHPRRSELGFLVLENWVIGNHRHSSWLAGRLPYGLRYLGERPFGTLGKMIGLQTIAIAAGATGLSTLEQGKLFRFTLRHSVIQLPAGGLIAHAYT
jgi:hypothetical protein